MGKNFEVLKNILYDKISSITYIEDIPEDFNGQFMELINNLNFMLIQDKDNFYGYFLFQMSREIKYDIKAPTAVTFKSSKYIVYFNPYLFLNLTSQQMKSSIKHEIHHILALHLIRAKKLKEKYSPLAINMAMDMVVNQYLDYLPPYATTLQWVNLKYNLIIEPDKSMEYYTEILQTQLDLLDVNEKSEEEDDAEKNQIEKEYDVSKTHDLWEKSSEADDETIKEFTEKFASLSDKGIVPFYVQSMIKNFNNNKSEIPWNIYLKKQMGTLEGDRKKTITRRNRRQPNRLDLRGELRGHIAKITLAVDISGSISEEEFYGAIKEVLNIVKSYKHEITILECDTEIRQVYKIKSINNIRKRSKVGGGTRFTPVFKYANNTDTNLLIYFTDGKGEEKLSIKPKGYKVIFVLTGPGNQLSLKETFGTIKRLKEVEINKDTIDLLDIKNEGWSMNSQQPLILLLLCIISISKLLQFVNFSTSIIS